MDLGTSAAFGAVSGLAVLADPTIKDDLSKPALAIATALDQGIGQALGLGKALSAAGTDLVANFVGDIASASADVAAIVGEVIQAVPIVGQLLGAVLKIMSLGLGGEKTPAQRCQEWQRLYAAVPTGSVLGSSGGQPYVPSDYFARVVDGTGTNVAQEDLAEAARSTGYPVHLGLITPGDRRFRSLLGMALMIITEGTPIDENDLSDKDWRSGKPPSWNPTKPPYALGLAELKKPKVQGMHIEFVETYGKEFGKLLMAPSATNLPSHARQSHALKMLYRRIVRANYEAVAKAWNNGTEDWGAGKTAKLDLQRAKRGLPRAWRARFRGLRRGIESLHRKGDGGAGAWILYMDLLASAFRRGYLSRDFIRWNLVVHDNFPCADGLADSIAQMASNWNNTIKPHYAQGKAKLETLVNAPQEPPNGPANSVERLRHTPAAERRFGSALAAASLLGVTAIVAWIAGSPAPPPLPQDAP